MICATQHYSPEAETKVKALSRDVLGREAGSGLAYFQKHLVDGWSLAQLRASFAGSPEAGARLTGLYRDVLGREPDAGGLSAWQGQLAQGWSLAQVRASFAGHSEAQARITNLYQADFGRGPSGAEMTSGQVQLASGLSLTDLNSQMLKLASSPVFVATTGNAAVSGTAGVDVFAFGPGAFGRDSVAGFDPARDLIQLSRTQFPTLAAALARTSPTASGALLAFDNENSVLLQNVAVGNLGASSFHFV